MRLAILNEGCNVTLEAKPFPVIGEPPYLFITRLSERGAAEVRGRFDVCCGQALLSEVKRKNVILKMC